MNRDCHCGKPVPESWTDWRNRMELEEFLRSEERPTPRLVEIVTPEDEPVIVLIAEGD